MKSRIRVIVAVLLLQLACVFAFSGCNGETVIDRLENRYGVDTKLLTGYEIVCDISGETFTGYAPHYAVILFEEEPTDFLNSYTKEESFSPEKNQSIKDALDVHKCMEIPPEHYPNWDEDYIWRGSVEMDGLCMIYFPNELKLIIFEAGH